VLPRLAALALAVPAAELDAQAIANIANGFARLGEHDAALFAHLHCAANSLAGDFTPQARPAPPCPRVPSHHHSHATPALCRAALRRRRAAQSVAVTLNAFAKAGALSPALVAALAPRLLAFPPARIRARDVSQAMHALGRAAVRNDRVLTHLAAALEEAARADAAAAGVASAREQAVTPQVWAPGLRGRVGAACPISTG